MKTNPLVSIVIPVYNGADYLAEAIDSALAQTYPEIEIIVINDGSTDGGKTEKIALSYSDRIRYYSKENGGVSSALNLGIREMRGEYFSWLSHDDVYAENKIAAEIDLLERCERNTMCFCTLRQINAQSKIISDKRALGLPDGSVLRSKDAVAYSLRHTINGCTVLIPKEAFDACGGFDEKMSYCQDVHMWWRILLKGYSLAYSDNIGVYSRVHSAQMTNTRMDLYYGDALKIAHELIPEFASMSDREPNLLLEYAKREARHANSKTLKLCFQAADERKLFSPIQKMRLRSTLLYGTAIRPLMRKIYYSMKTGT